MARRVPLASTVSGNGNGPTSASRATRPAGHVTAAALRSRNRTGKPQPKPAPLAKATAK